MVKSGANPSDRDAFVTCECGSPEHVARFSYFAPDPARSEQAHLYLSIHIRGWEGFWKRLWVGLKYAFGYRSRYGEWDEVIVTRRSAEQIVGVCSDFLRHCSSEDEGVGAGGQVPK